MNRLQIFKRRTGKIHIKRLPTLTAALYRDQRILARHKAVIGSSTADKIRWTCRYIQYAAPHHDLTIVIGPHENWKVAAVGNKRTDILYMLLQGREAISPERALALWFELGCKIASIYNEDKRLLLIADFSGELLPKYQELLDGIKWFFKSARSHDGEAIVIHNTEGRVYEHSYCLQPDMYISPIPSKPHTARAVWGAYGEKLLFIKY